MAAKRKVLERRKIARILPDGCPVHIAVGEYRAAGMVIGRRKELDPYRGRGNRTMYRLEVTDGDLCAGYRDDEGHLWLPRHALAVATSPRPRAAEPMSVPELVAAVQQYIARGTEFAGPDEVVRDVIWALAHDRRLRDAWNDAVDAERGCIVDVA
jgi:hypothetical protein